MMIRLYTRLLRLGLRKGLDHERASGVLFSVSAKTIRRCLSVTYPIPEWMGTPLQKPAGPLFGVAGDDNPLAVTPESSEYFIPQVPLHDMDGRQNKKRVLILCTGGTLTMAPNEQGALAPVQGALLKYLVEMRELHADHMPEVVAYE
jgi:hypothetical protein